MEPHNLIIFLILKATFYTKKQKENLHSFLKTLKEEIGNGKSLVKRNILNQLMISH